MAVIVAGQGNWADCRRAQRQVRVGLTGYKTLLNNEGRDIEVVNEAESGKEDLLQDHRS